MTEPLNQYRIESNLFRLLVEAIKDENPNPDSGVETLTSVLSVYVDNLGRQADSRFPTFTEYESALKAAQGCSDMIDALLENHPDQIRDSDSQAGRMLNLLVEVRHGLETVCWDVEDRMPEFQPFFRKIRDPNRVQ